MATDQKLIDKNGIEITNGSVIYNRYDSRGYYKVILKNGLLCFADGEPLSDKYCLHEFWEVFE